MYYGLDEKVALVAGSSQGIESAVAATLVVAMEIQLKLKKVIKGL